MREIKFRAWDKKSKKMRDIDMISFHNKRGCFDYDNSNLPKVVNVWGRDMIEDKDCILHREGNDYVLQQFTGLKDKNGIEIYEGDIIEADYGIGLVVFNDTTCSFKYDFDLDSDDLWLYASKSEIIGNIYENKELI